jgi:hypothetical protein
VLAATGDTGQRRLVLVAGRGVQVRFADRRIFGFAALEHGRSVSFDGNWRALA